MINWKDDRFSVYDEEEISVLELIEDLADKFKTLQELDTNQEVVDARGEYSKLDDRLDNIDDEIGNYKQTFKKYEKGTELTNENANIQLEGCFNVAKNTYGRYEQATVLSAIANTDTPYPQVLGTDSKGLATYTNRDSVALYTENTGHEPLLTIEGSTYTSNTVTLPNNVNMDIIKIGMVVDVGTRVNDDWCVGIVKEVDDHTLIMEDGFYKVRNDGKEPTKVTPSNGLKCRINMNNKVWVINSNMFINEGCPAGANMEIGVLCNHSDINDVGAIDVINMRNVTHYGVKVRNSGNPFSNAFYSINNNSAFIGENSNIEKGLLEGVYPGGTFKIGIDGTMSRLQLKPVVVNVSCNLPDCGILFCDGDGIDITLPFAQNNDGRVLTIITNASSGGLLTCENGNGFRGVDVNQQQISFNKRSGGYMRAITLMSTGSTLWYIVSDTN